MAFKLTLGTIFVTYVFADPSNFSATTLLPLAAGLRVQPFSFLFAVTLVFAMVFLICGISLVGIQKKVNGERPGRMFWDAVVSVNLLLSFFAVFTLIIPQFDKTAFVAIWCMVSMPIWVLVVLGAGKRSVTWCLAWGVTCVASPFSVVPNLLLVALVFALPHVRTHSERCLWAKFEQGKHMIANSPDAPQIFNSAQTQELQQGTATGEQVPSQILKQGEDSSIGYDISGTSNLDVFM